MERELIEAIEKVCWESDGLFREPFAPAYGARRVGNILDVRDSDTGNVLFRFVCDKKSVVRIERCARGGRDAFLDVMARVFDAYNQE